MPRWSAAAPGRSLAAACRLSMARRASRGPAPRAILGLRRHGAAGRACARCGRLAGAASSRRARGSGSSGRPPTSAAACPATSACSSRSATSAASNAPSVPVRKRPPLCAPAGARQAGAPPQDRAAAYGGAPEAPRALAWQPCRPGRRGPVGLGRGAAAASRRRWTGSEGRALSDGWAGSASAPGTARRARRGPRTGARGHQPAQLPQRLQRLRLGHAGRPEARRHADLRARGAGGRGHAARLCRHAQGPRGRGGALQAQSVLRRWQKESMFDGRLPNLCKLTLWAHERGRCCPARLSCPARLARP